MFFDPRKAKLLEPGNHMLIEGCKDFRLEARDSCKRWVYRWKNEAGKIKQVVLGLSPAVPFARGCGRREEAARRQGDGARPPYPVSEY